MRIAILTLQWLIRACAVVQVVLGVLFWTGNAFTLLQVHMLTGIVLVLGALGAGIACRPVGTRLDRGTGGLPLGRDRRGPGLTQDSLAHRRSALARQSAPSARRTGRQVGMAESLAVRALRRISPRSR